MWYSNSNDVLPKRSLMTDMNAENEVRIRRTPNTSSYKQSGSPTKSAASSPEHDRQRRHPMHTTIPTTNTNTNTNTNTTENNNSNHTTNTTPRKTRNGRPPQDRSYIDTSTTSVVSARSIGSHGSKCSTATPNLIFTTATTLPVTSPPFPLISPADGRAGVGKTSPPPPPPPKTSCTKHTTNSAHGSSVLLSPPKMKTAAACNAAPSRHNFHMDMKRKESHGTYSSLQDIRKEIHELTSQFAKLEHESQQRRAIFDLDPQDRFDESLGIMGQKADAMVDALHRSYIQLSELSKENVNLKQQIKNIHQENISNENEKLYKVNQNEKSKVLLQRLDSSDDYVKRTYPSVPKTPGTMFTTELVEVMSLDVGDHAYLAQIMDRQWNTSTDYRPNKQQYDTT